MKSGIELIAAERERQISEEGWSASHDDTHRNRQLAQAALAYCEFEAFPHPTYSGDAPATWPWEIRWWKPDENPIRNLVKAGALIAAEIDRLQRTQ